MRSEREQLRHQVELIKEAMQNAGKWSESVPSWVFLYQANTIPDFWEWLQYVYLPQRMYGVHNTFLYLAPQVKDYANMENRADSILLQRIVELDSMTSTLAQCDQK